MRSLVRLAGVVGVTAVLGATGVAGAVGSYAADAADGDERVAHIRARVVDKVNRETRAELERLRQYGDDASRAEAERLERRLRDSGALSAQLHSIRTPTTRGSAAPSDEHGPRAVRAAREVTGSAPLGTGALVLGTSVLLVGGGAAVASVRWQRDGQGKRRPS
ncbi:hypothetical protein [Streptomyces sp. cg36]|uniref:hypothetical protein n=1 Tax=Streptomyces sp. cg36 TaxID=3238798 RepID=UPI0034E20DA3